MKHMELRSNLANSLVMFGTTFCVIRGTHDNSRGEIHHISPIIIIHHHTPMGPKSIVIIEHNERTFAHTSTMTISCNAKSNIS